MTTKRLTGAAHLLTSTALLVVAGNKLKQQNLQQQINQLQQHLKDIN